MELQFVDELVSDVDVANIRPEATFLQRACRVWGLNERIKPLRDCYVAKVLGTTGNALDNLNGLVRMHSCFLCHLHCCACDDELAARYLLVDGNKGRIVNQLNNFRNFNRLAFVIQAIFFLEALLSDLVTVRRETPEKNFRAIVNQVRKLYSISGERADAFIVLSLIRNTQHNQGIHTSEDKTICLQHVEFIFERNRSCKTATWDHIVYALASAFDLYSAVVAHVEKQPS